MPHPPIPTAEFRAQIVELVKESGKDGISSLDISHALSRSHSVVKTHVCELKKAGILSGDRIGAGAKVYMAGAKPLYTMYERALMLVEEKPGITAREICTQLGLTGGSKSHYMRRLRDTGDCKEVKAERLMDFRYWRNPPKVIDEIDDMPVSRRIIKASDAPRLRVRMGVRSVFELANV